MAKATDKKGKKGGSGKKKEKVASAPAAKKAPKRRASSRSAGEAPGTSAQTAVTLQEARALIAPKSRTRGAAAESAPPAGPSPEPIGVAREVVAEKHRAEVDRRYDEYAKLIDVMSTRGAKSPAPVSRGRGARKATADTSEAFAPLKVFAEGDSWFDYPVPFFGGGIVPRLEERIGVPILNLAKAGDEVRYMLGVEQRERLTKILKRGNPGGGAWELLLFSGGGNDIVDNPMALWIKDWDPNVPPSELLHDTRFDAALTLVIAGYEDLIALRDEHSPDTHVIFHAYDFVIPDGRGICHLGPWLKPTFELRRFPNRTAMSAVMEAMLTRFAGRLEAFAKQHKKVSFINTQGTLTRARSSWHNELHPSSKGFNKFVALFYGEIKQLFPARVG